jgi:hypothetical protein
MYMFVLYCAVKARWWGWSWNIWKCTVSPRNGLSLLGQGESNRGYDESVKGSKVGSKVLLERLVVESWIMWWCGNIGRLYRSASLMMMDLLFIIWMKELFLYVMYSTSSPVINHLSSLSLSFQTKKSILDIREQEKSNLRKYY